MHDEKMCAVRRRLMLQKPQWSIGIDICIIVYKVQSTKISIAFKRGLSFLMIFWSPGLCLLRTVTHI